MIINHILCRFEITGITASSHKLVAATSQLHIVGLIVLLEGWHLVHRVVNKILMWVSCMSITNVQSFLDIAEVAQKWVQGFLIIVWLLIKLTTKLVEFIWMKEVQDAMNLIKIWVTSAPVLCLIDYN